MKTITLTTFTGDTPYLSYGFDCSGEKCWSGFTLFDEKFTKTIAALLPEDNQKLFLSNAEVEIEDELFSVISMTWHKRMYKKYRSVYVPRDANMEHVKVAYESYLNRVPVMVQYMEGFEMYPSDDENSCTGNDGLTHLAYVGKSTGVKPCLLFLESQCSGGGSSFMFAGIKDIKLAGGALCVA